jgi:hypothetical protein
MITLATIPKSVYKLPDTSHEPSESWVFNLMVQSTDQPDLTPYLLTAELFSGATLVKTSEIRAPMLDLLRAVRHRPNEGDAPDSNRWHATQDELYDIRLRFSEYADAAIDRVRCSLLLDAPTGERLTAQVDVPIRVYQQKTRLIFPLAHNTVITQGNVHNGGHREWSTQFALDLMGCTPSFAPLTGSTESVNEDYAGWGMDVIAMAAGRVSYARADVPDNPDPSAPDESLWASLPEPVWASTGNCVMLDHGNGEWTFVSHMMQGSVTVRAGDHVEQGQVIGRLGNSGDSTNPHLHVHMQAGPRVFGFDGLPMTFANLPPGTRLARGEFVTAGVRSDA